VGDEEKKGKEKKKKGGTWKVRKKHKAQILAKNIIGNWKGECITLGCRRPDSDGWGKGLKERGLPCCQGKQGQEGDGNIKTERRGKSTCGVNLDVRGDTLQDRDLF